MKKSSYLKTAVLLAGFAVGGLAHGLDQPKMTVDEFRAKTRRDDSPLPGDGHLQMSYSGVVEKILPSVVTIASFGKPKASPMLGGGGMDQLPPGFEEFFRRRFGLPDEGEDGGESNPFEDQQPRQRKRPGSGGQRPAPKVEPDQRLGLGSGIIISQDGYILTNNHVVEGGNKLEIEIDNPGSPKRTYEAKVIGRDPLTDVALIKIDATGLTYATIGDSAKLRVGDIVLAAGAPMELSHSVSQGIVSAMGRSGLGIVGNRMQAGYENFIQTDAAINMGNSGGALVDALGRVVGINTAILSRSGMNAGIGFAIPINMAMSVVEDLIAHGKIRRGFLGIGMDPIDAQLARDLGLPDQDGTVVKEVRSQTPAKSAGFEVGDIVVSLNGEKVSGPDKLRLIVSSKKPGEKVQIEVLRDKQKKILSATLGSVPDGSGVSDPADSPEEKIKPAAPVELLAGVVALNLTPELAKRYEIAKDVEGVVVTKVAPDSSAAAVGLTEGDVIEAINRTPVKNLDEAKPLVSGDKEKSILKVHRKGASMLFIVRD